ncbi:MAG: DoxX family protein [bacterium]|nr:DoxX family protein [bacterium]
MDIVLWILQILLALVFGMVGFLKITQSKEKVLASPMADRMGWVNDFTQGQLRIIGSLEVLGAIGLILPKLTNILPWLTPLAAAGLILVMIGAALTHLRRKESPIPNVILGGLLVIILVGYWSLLSF